VQLFQLNEQMGRVAITGFAPLSLLTGSIRSVGA